LKPVQKLREQANATPPTTASVVEGLPESLTSFEPSRALLILRDWRRLARGPWRGGGKATTEKYVYYRLADDCGDGDF
jgi:hypothetical protein